MESSPLLEDGAGVDPSSEREARVSSCSKWGEIKH